MQNNENKKESILSLFQKKVEKPEDEDDPKIDSIFKSQNIFGDFFNVDFGDKLELKKESFVYDRSIAWEVKNPDENDEKARSLFNFQKDLQNLLDYYLNRFDFYQIKMTKETSDLRMSIISHLENKINEMRYIPEMNEQRKVK